MKNLKFKKNKGFTLIEILVVLGIVVTAIVIILNRAEAARTKSTGNTIVTELTDMANNILKYHPGEIANINTDKVYELDLVAKPYKKLIGGNKSIVLPGTSSVDVAPNATNTATDITLNGIKSNLCTYLLTNAWDIGDVIKVDGVSVKSSSTDTVISQSALIESNCQTATNVISYSVSI